MSDAKNGKIQAIINTVTEKTGISRAVVVQVVDAMLELGPVQVHEVAQPIGESRQLPEIRMHPDVDESGMSENDRERIRLNRTKLGGEPEWIQAPDQPACCGRFATFYGQIDSNLGDEFGIVDAGRLYVFVCDQCLQTYCELQYY